MAATGVPLQFGVLFLDGLIQCFGRIARRIEISFELPIDSYFMGFSGLLSGVLGRAGWFSRCAVVRCVSGAFPHL